MCHANAFMKMATIVCTVNNVKLTFLVDSSATHSVTTTQEPSPKLSSSFVSQDSATVTSKYSFLMFDLCPINLLGRDLMCVFGFLSPDKAHANSKMLHSNL